MLNSINPWYTKVFKKLQHEMSTAPKEIEIMTNCRPFIRGKVAIDSMRDNGYKNAAYAIAELVDNSIQAGANIVNVICFEEVSLKQQKSLKNVKKIGILDNGSGMDKDILHMALEFGASENRKNKNGMGKFGMGLPNSSISQCKRVEVWTWKNKNEIYYTYLDIEVIRNGDLDFIPEPEIKSIPNEILVVLNDKLPESGTFVLWSDLDRLQWKTSASIYKHSEALIGRMYRYFLHDESVTIWFNRFLMVNGAYKEEQEPQKFRANDPLYLLKNTSLPELPSPYKNEPFFNQEIEEHLEIMFNNEPHEVVIKGSVVNHSIYKKIREIEKSKAGTTKWGKHAATNFGISVVRAKREIELKNAGFFNKDLRDKGRFIGVEVLFLPGLDHVFGVLNNKQAAVNLYNVQKEEEAEREGLSVKEYEDDLGCNNDPKLQLISIATSIASVIDRLKKNLAKLDFSNSKHVNDETNGGYKTGLKATEASNYRAGKAPVESDAIQPTLEDIKSVLNISHGEKGRSSIPSPEEILQRGLRYEIEEIAFDSQAFFDVTSKNGFTLVQINKNHPFYNKIILEVGAKQQGMLELALAAWSRMEAESGSNQREQYKNARRRWGEVLTDFLGSDDDW